MNKYFLKINKQKNKLGIVLISLTLFLVLFGVLMVYSASFYYAEKTYNNPYFFLLKQVIGFFVGFICMFLLSKLNYNKLQNFYKIALLVGYILLVLVFVPGVGVSNYGATRWIRLPGFTIQSSEIAKFCFVLFASVYLSKNYKKVKTFKGILPIIVAGGLMCLLIILEPNMSITMCVGIVMIIMLLVGGISFKHFMCLAIPALILVPVLIIIEPYRFDRLMAFINPWASPKGEGYQLIQSFFSISSGGLFGVGLFNSRQKYLFLPFAESDFIFSVIAEEFGLVGCLLLLAVYFAVIVCGIKIAIRAKNRFGCFLATGITAVIAVQTLLNVSVVSGLIPPTGLPLPFISSGSTSIVVFMSAIGVLLNINKQNNECKINCVINSKKLLKKPKKYPF
ncbi:MAG: putative lipid II flippase FtsW, partial [Clostridia bacterium]|nr:putative lipid II flippase FtsW [Clostridia bacterium]